MGFACLRLSCQDLTYQGFPRQESEGTPKNAEVAAPLQTKLSLCVDLFKSASVQVYLYRSRKVFPLLLKMSE